MNIEQIDFQPLCNTINDLLQLPDVIKPEMFEFRGDKRPHIKCPNLLEYAGSIGKAIWNDCSVTFFNWEANNDVLWATVYVHYEYKGRGSNMGELLTCWYYPSTQSWVFQDANRNTL